MWNPFRTKNKNKPQEPTTIPGDLSCIALHELPTGDVRAVAYTTDGTTLQTVSCIGLEANVYQNTQGPYEFTVRHVLDSQYAYGVAYLPLAEDSFVYEDLHAKGFDNHTILRCNQIDDMHYCWSALETDLVIRSQKSRPDQSIGTGLTGISRLFGLHEDVVFLYISFERQVTTVSLLRGSAVLIQGTVPVGTSTLIRTIADTLACPTDMARRIVETHGVIDTHYDHRLKHRVVATMLPVQELVRQIVGQYSAQPYRPAYARSPIVGWVLGGVGASMPGIASLLGIYIPGDLIDEIANPYKKMIVEIPDGPHRDILPRYYTVLGLAISGA